MVRAYSALDVCVCLTVGDAEALGDRQRATSPARQVLAIANAVPARPVQAGGLLVATSCVAAGA